MPSPTQLRGGRAEQRAVFYLQRHGYRILDRHYTSRYGEIDILAEKAGTPYIVEVKYRSHEGAWPIELAMTQRKIERLLLTYTYWLEQQQKKHPPPRMIWLLITPATIRHIDL